MSACVKCGYDCAAPVLGTWTLTIGRLVHSMNARRVNSGGSRWAYRNERDGWQNDLKACRIMQRIPTATGRRRVTFVRQFSGRERAFDYGNLVGGCKVVLDAMVREGLLVDDAARFVEDHYQQQRAETSGLVVILEELGA